MKKTVLCSESENTTSCEHEMDGHKAVRVAEVEPAASVAAVRVRTCGPTVVIVKLRSLSKNRKRQ